MVDCDDNNVSSFHHLLQHVDNYWYQNSQRWKVLPYFFFTLSAAQAGRTSEHQISTLHGLACWPSVEEPNWLKHNHPSNLLSSLPLWREMTYLYPAMRLLIMNHPARRPNRRHSQNLRRASTLLVYLIIWKFPASLPQILRSVRRMGKARETQLCHQAAVLAWVRKILLLYLKNISLVSFDETVYHCSIILVIHWVKHISGLISNITVKDLESYFPT